MPKKHTVHPIMGFVSICLIFSVTNVFARSPVQYEISFANAAHHEANVVVTFSELGQEPLQIRMSRTSPGRYALHEFAKNIYGVKVFDGAGRVLQAERPDLHEWDIGGHDGTVRFEYTIYGDRADGTYLGVDSSHAHLNMPATFVWARKLQDRPIQVRFHRPDAEWKIATQLVPTEDPELFTAPDLAYFLDSPTEISQFELREWKAGPEATIRVALHHDGTDEEVDAFTRIAQAIVLEQAAIFGGLPRFDSGVYTFIVDYLPHVFGDGMEHRNSTIVSSSQGIDRRGKNAAGTVSHEFFHAWNVERMRPRSLEPFDFENANVSGELWFAEGFTSYYGSLVLHRAGVTSVDDWARNLSGLLGIVNAPGRRYYSPVEMSRQAPFVDAATSVDSTNRANTFVSYYSYGAALALGLDLSLRSRFEGLSLDDFMKAAWKQYGIPEKPYTNRDLEAVLAEVTGDSTFARDFFGRYVYGSELPDYAALLKEAGFRVRQRDPEAAWWGRASFQFDETGATLRSGTVVDTPLYDAGLDRGDRILSADGEKITSQEVLREFLQDREPGAVITLEFEKRGQARQVELMLKSNPALEAVPFEHLGKTITDSVSRFRKDWLQSKVSEQTNLRVFCPRCHRSFPMALAYCHYDGERLKLTPVSEP